MIKLKVLSSSQKGNLQVIQEFFESGKISLTKEFFNEQPILHYFSGTPHLRIVQYLVRKGANVNQTDQYGITPLMCAVKKDQFDIVDFLVKNGIKFFI